MRILAAGDIHGDIMSAEKLARQAEEENVDLVILCGDITFFETPFQNLLKQFKNKKVLMIPGNHEGVATNEFLAEIYGLKNLHGYAVRYEDIGIFGAGGCTKVGPSPTLSEDEMLELLKKGFERIKYLPKKIMVTHEHPSGSVIEFNKTFLGSDSIKKAVDEFSPDVLICGHIHEAEGIEEKIGPTQVISVGKGGKIIEL